MQRNSNVQPSSEMHGTATANMQNTGDAMSIISVIPEPPQSDRPSKSNSKSRKKSKQTAPTPVSKKAPNTSTSTPADAKRIGKGKKAVARAIALRQQFPAMQNIPDSITPSQRKKLVLNHTQNSVSTLQPTPSATNEGPRNAVPAPPTQSMKRKKAVTDEKQRSRAALLKQQYPQMEGIPAKIGQGTKKKLIAQYKAKSSALTSTAKMPTSSSKATKSGPHPDELPTRRAPPAHTLGTYPTRQVTRLRETPASLSATSDAILPRPTSYKMAPLSEERRAEVARNLAAGSNSDPVMVD